MLRRIWRSLPAPIQTLVRSVRHPHLQAIYRKDFRWFERKTRWILEALGRRPAPHRGEVLIHGLHGFVPSFKEEFVFAAMLQWHGYRPVFLVNPTGLLERYVSQLPHATFLDWRSYGPVPTPKERSHARQLLDEAKDVESLVHLEHGGVAIGRHALSWYMRNRRLGTLVLKRDRDGLADQVADALAAARAAQSCLADRSLRSVLMNERGYTPYGEFFDAALIEGRRVIQYVSSHRDDARVFKAYAMDTRTEHPYSLSPESWEQALSENFNEADEHSLLSEWEGFYRDRTWFNFQRLQHRTSLRDPDSILESIGLDPRRKTAVIYAHIFWDATFFYGNSLYEDYQQWFLETVRLANGNDKLNWIVKLHPVNVWRYAADGAVDARYSELEALDSARITLSDHVRVLMPETEFSSWSLYEATDYCLTVRGTVGIENAALGNCVVTAGSGHYSGRGFTLDPSSVQEYRQLLSRIDELPPLAADMRLRALRYGNWLLRRKPYPFGSYRMTYQSGSNVFHPLNGSLDLLATDAEAFFETDKARQWVEWVTNGTQADCIFKGPRKAACS